VVLCSYVVVLRPYRCNFNTLHIFAISLSKFDFNISLYILQWFFQLILSSYISVGVHCLVMNTTYLRTPYPLLLKGCKKLVMKYCIICRNEAWPVEFCSEWKRPLGLLLMMKIMETRNVNMTCTEHEGFHLVVYTTCWESCKLYSFLFQLASTFKNWFNLANCCFSNVFLQLVGIHFWIRF
jgi:hypothetical protein